MQFLMLSNTLGSLDVGGLATAVFGLGPDGVGLSVRPGGDAEPEYVQEKLPEAVGILGSYGLKVPMVTTSVVDARDPGTESIFRTASELAIPYLKPGYWRYEGFGRLNKAFVPWPEIFSYLRQISFDGPVSLYSEYEDLSVSQIISQTAEDLSYLRETICRL